MTQPKSLIPLSIPQSRTNLKSPKSPCWTPRNLSIWTTCLNKNIPVELETYEIEWQSKPETLSLRLSMVQMSGVIVAKFSRVVWSIYWVKSRCSPVLSNVERPQGLFHLIIKDRRVGLSTIIFYSHWLTPLQDIRYERMPMLLLNDVFVF